MFIFKFRRCIQYRCIIVINCIYINTMIIFQFRGCIQYRGIPALNCIYIRQELHHPITNTYWGIIILTIIKSRSRLVTILTMVYSFTNITPGAIDATGIRYRRGRHWLWGMDNMCCNRNWIFAYHENCMTSYISLFYLWFPYRWTQN